MPTLHRLSFLLALAFASPLVACGGSTPDPDEADQTPPDEGGEGAEPGPAERPSLTAEECEAQGGQLVGDIGDGATQRPDYVCPSGSAPLGTVPLGIEGSVCCAP